LEEDELKKEKHDLQFLGQIANTLGYSDENVNNYLLNLLKLIFNVS
jgi:hypothetical protein